MNKRLSQVGITLSLGVILTLGSSLTRSSWAQSRDAFNEGYQNNEQNSLTGGGTFGDLNPLDLIHRAKFNNGRSAEEFNQESQVNIENSASEYKRLQQERILQQYQSPGSSIEPTVTDE